jgi:hypothetical protein
MVIMDNFINDIFERLASEAGRLARYKYDLFNYFIYFCYFILQFFLFLLLKLASVTPLLLAKSKPLFVCSSQENWPNMPSLKEQRPSPNTTAPIKVAANHCEPFFYFQKPKNSDKKNPNFRPCSTTILNGVF